MSYQPIYRVLRECKIQLLSEVGDECYAYLLNMLKHRVSCGKLTPAKDDRYLDGARHLPRSTQYTLGFAIPFPKSSGYDFAHFRISKTTVEYVDYIFIWNYTLHKRKSQQ